MLTFAKRFFADEAGGTAIEYALIASGICLAIFTTIGQVGSSLSTAFTSVNDGFTMH